MMKMLFHGKISLKMATVTKFNSPNPIFSFPIDIKI